MKYSCFCSLAKSCQTFCDPQRLWHVRLPCPSLSLDFAQIMSIELLMPSNHLSSVVPFSSCLQSFPASGAFQISQLFASGGQRIQLQHQSFQRIFSILGLTGLISLQSKGLSRVFSNTTVQKHQFISAQLSFQANSHIHT